MSEYQVKFRIKVIGLFSPKFESVEVYEAETGRLALRKCTQEFKDQILKAGIDSSEARLEILDITKL